MSSAGQPVDPVQALAAQAGSPGAATLPGSPMDPVQALAMGQLSPTASASPPAPQHATDPQSLGDQVRSYLGGVNQGLYSPVQSLAELGARGLDAVGVTHGAYPAVHKEFQDENAIAIPDQTSRFAKGGQTVGNIVSTLPTMAINPVAGEGLVAAGANGILQGGAYNALTSSNSDAPLSKQVALGMMLGGVGGAASNVAGRVIAPKISQAARTLMDSGVTLTPGQILGGGLKRAEDAATSIPVIGDFIKSRQRDALVGFNTGVANEALAPIGKSVPAGVTGHAAVKYVSDQLGHAYDALLPKLSAVPDQQFLTDIASMKQSGKMTYLLTGEKAGQLGDIIDNEVMGRLSGNQPLTGDELKSIQSNLGFQARKFAKSPSPDDQNLSDAIMDVRSKVNDLISRQNPNEAPELANINSGWAQYVRLNKAAQAQNAKDGIFTASQFSNAVKSSTPDKRVFGLGKALLQDYAKAGIDVLPSSVPDSGTPFRHALQLAGAALLGHEMLPQNAEAVLGAAAPIAAGATALYSQPGVKIAQTVLAKRPALAMKIGKMLQAGSAGAVPLTAVASPQIVGSQ